MNKAYSTPHCDGVANTSTPAFGKRLFQIMSKDITFDMIKNSLTAILRPAVPVTKVTTQQEVVTSKAIEHIDLLGVPVHLVTENRLHEYIANVIEKGRKELVLNVNVHCYNMIFKNPWMRDFFNKAGMVFCDGSGVALGAKILGLRTPIRFTPADSIWNLAALAEKKGHSFYFLGAKKGIAEKAAQKMQERYPNLKITTHHGYFNKDRNSPENQKIIKKINNSGANILVVGFGMPIQEKWLQENWEQLNVNIGFPAGALFDYVSGELRRGPSWMTDNGLEWLARMLIEPQRLWKRYLIGNTVFLYEVIAERLTNIARETATAVQETLTDTVATGKEMFTQTITMIARNIFPQPAYVDKINRRVDIITGRRTALRKHRRIKLNGYSAEIANNGVRYHATIKDVSPDGLQLGNIPALLTKQGDHLNVTVSNLLGAMEYQLTIKQQWVKKEGKMLTAAGFSIINAPTEWKNLMPQAATN